MYNNPLVKPYERLYLEIFRTSSEFVFNDKFEAVGRRGCVGGATRFAEAMRLPDMFVHLDDRIVDDISKHSSKVRRVVMG